MTIGLSAALAQVLDFTLAYGIETADIHGVGTVHRLPLRAISVAMLTM
jgi:hypothetical protein